MNNQFAKFYAAKQWNECIALALGRKPPLDLGLETWTKLYKTNEDIYYWHCEDGRTATKQEWDLRHYWVLNGKVIDINWDSDKNLWVEGSEVVEYVDKNNLESAFIDKLFGLDEGVSAVGKEFGWDAITLPPLDYAKALVEVIKEQQ